MSEQEFLKYLIQYLIEESYVDNEESGLVLLENVSDTALLEYASALKALPAAAKIVHKSVPFIRNAVKGARAAKAAKATAATGAAVKTKPEKDEVLDKVTNKNWLTRGLRSQPRETEKDTKPKPEKVQEPKKAPAPTVEPKPEKAPDSDGDRKIKPPSVKKPTQVPTDTPTGNNNPTRGSVKSPIQQNEPTKQRTPTKPPVKQKPKKKKKPGKKVGIPPLGLPKLGLGADTGSTRAIGGRHISKISDPNESFEMVCDFLIQEGYAETGPQAEAMYNHMSVEWMEYIHEQF